MAIGAGPGSTGGGFKVSTFMTLLTRAGASFRGQERANFAKRTIPERAVERATATALVFVAIAFVALVALLGVESGGKAAERPRWFLDASFGMYFSTWNSRVIDWYLHRSQYLESLS